ncbi:hypothetical protein IWQ56_003111, partial [Coemansia nantahalensis]
NWNVFCLDPRRRTGDLGELGEVFYANPHILEYELLRHRPVNRPAPATPPVAPLECLPPHMKRKICSCLAKVDVDGLLCLILAVPHLAADGRATLSRVMSWAGKRIITLGKYADDVPENLLTEEEDEELYINFPEKNYVINEHSFVLLLGEATSEFYPKTHRFLEARHMTARLRTDDSSWLHFSLKCLIRPPITQPTDAVLRNLTLKQYYRSSGYCPGG